MSRALFRGAACQSCRHEILRSFLIVSGVPLPRFTAPLPRPIHPRAFSAVGPLRSDGPPTPNQPGIDLPPVEENSQPPEPNAAVASRHVPWYLQEKPPIAEDRPVAGDHIPPVPENSPEILPTILEYSYKDLGLDGLKIFDLRGLETPAALGSSVIMVVGTARSVKHLNVSADRLCRWLRSQYKLSPHADGLLGRNELKIKLRRKAKRARAASQAGGMVDEKDDGITTGWICVNAGVVDQDSPKAQLSDAGFEGFGDLELGTSVVVQMFTEEKRADVDLEGLWQASLDRAEKRRLEESTDAAPAADPRAASPSSYSGIGTLNGQKRSFHTTRRLATPDVAQPNLSSAFPDMANPLPTSLHNADAPGSGLTPASLLRILAELPNASARSELGSGPDDRKSTLFLRLFYANRASSFSPQERAVFRLRLLSIAVSRQHPAYSKDNLFSTFSDFLRDSHELPDELGFEVVSALLAPRAVDLLAHEPTLYLPEADRELALLVLDRLSLRGVPVLNMKVFQTLFRVVDLPSTAPTPSSNSESSGSEPNTQMMPTSRRTESQQQILSRLSKIVAAAEMPFDADEARKLMGTLFQYEDYDGFWRLWRQMPLKGVNRMQADYLQLFQLHAELGDERKVRECLSMWVPMMARESPPVVLQGPLVTAIMHCLLVADPAITEHAAEGATPYFAQLWTDCQQALARGS
ncbi:hypothetical protein NUU61_004385 [Penicillium alfredii]|uniref:ATPase synthesis protein 25 n=1 Tax=Penicillium alfredii TaxID=1506179 RepID=A0A9W9KDY5_9EURO|nr:uncharacterized protein NUU61_004385 [Penicillium alfredii]KAJ5102163.1 hypothetical protein NUU61_004385 [Penicillium alfredii]